MSSARITIGGSDVIPRAGKPGVGALPAAESQGSASVDGMYDGKHAPVILTVERAPGPRCPLSPGPWRIISALGMLGLVLFSLVAVLSERRRRFR